VTQAVDLVLFTKGKIPHCQPIGVIYGMAKLISLVGSGVDSDRPQSVDESLSKTPGEKSHKVIN
jgi:hypothetical protein